MDLPQLHSHRLQQIHPRQKDVQLAIPDLPHHDPHGLLRLPRLPHHPRLQARGARFHVPRPLHLLCSPHRRPLRLLPLALQFRLHLPLRLLHPDAQGPHARCRLLHRRPLQKRALQIQHSVQHAFHFIWGRRRRLRGGPIQCLGSVSPIGGRRFRGYQTCYDSDFAYLQRDLSQSHYFSVLRCPLLFCLSVGAVGVRGVPDFEGVVRFSIRFCGVRDEFVLRVCAQSRGVFARREDVGADHECRRSC